jgi:hypothetical protein
MLSEL